MGKIALINNKVVFAENKVSCDCCSQQCDGCGILNEILGEVNSINVSGSNDVGSYEFSLVEPFTSYNAKCNGGGDCTQNFDEAGFNCCEYNSNQCGFSMSKFWVWGNDGCSHYSRGVSGALRKFEGNCYLHITAGVAFDNCGPDSGEQYGGIDVPLESIIGTHSVYATGFITVNWETRPWNSTINVTIS